MIKFHINKKGNAETCNAGKGANPRGCPFGGDDEHFPTEAGARAWFESTQKAVPNIKGISVGGEVEYDFHADDLQKAIDTIAKANKRLEKSGVTERFTYEVEEYFKSVEEGRILRTEPRVKITMNTPSVRFEGYSFVGLVETAEAGVIVKAAYDANLGDYRPTDQKCEACGKNMGRAKTYLVRDDEGNYLQVGSTCVKNYFGVEPAGLWALSYGLKFNPSQVGGSGALHSSAFPTENLLAYALVVSKGGEDFVSNSYSYDTGRTSTAEQVRDALEKKRNDEAFNDEAEKYIRSGEVNELLDYMAEMDQTTDYGKNMRVLSGGSQTRYKHINLLVSSLALIAKKKREEAKAKDLAEWGTVQPGFVAPVGEKMKGRKFKVFLTDQSESYNPRSGRDEWSTRVVLRDEDNHEAIWWASRYVSYKKGTVVTSSSGTVKEHGNYQGKDQTVLTRMKFLEAEEPDSED